jgi:hypothetical protein
LFSADKILFFATRDVSALNAVMHNLIQVMSESKTSGSELTAVQDFCRMFDGPSLLDICNFQRTAVDEITKEIRPPMNTHLNGLLMGDKNIQKHLGFDLVIRESKEIDEIIRGHIEKVKKTAQIAYVWAMLKVIEPDDWVSSMQRKLYDLLDIDDPNDGHYHWNQVYPKISELSQDLLVQCEDDWIAEDDIANLAKKYDTHANAAKKSKSKMLAAPCACQIKERAIYALTLSVIALLVANVSILLILVL